MKCWHGVRSGRSPNTLTLHYDRMMLLLDPTSLARDRHLHRRIDVRELGITIRMVGALTRLAVGISSRNRFATTRWLAWNPWAAKALTR